MGGFDSQADDHKNHNITQSISVRIRGNQAMGLDTVSRRLDNLKFM